MGLNVVFNIMFFNLGVIPVVVSVSADGAGYRLVLEALVRRAFVSWTCVLRIVGFINV